MNGQRLLIALAFALLGSGTLTWQLNRHLVHGASPASPVPLQQVVVAAHDLAPGDKIVQASVTTIVVPGKKSLPGLLSHPQEIMGRPLLVSVGAGEPILLHELSSISKNDSADEVPVGMRLIAISGPGQPQEGAELLEPGSHADVLVSYRSGPENVPVTSVVLQNVLVRNSGRKTVASSGVAPPSGQLTSLLVTPEQATQLVAASSLGKLTFTLRNQADEDQRSGLSRITLSAKEGKKVDAVAPRSSFAATPRSPVHKLYAVETLSGGKTSIQTFQDGQP